MNSNRPTFLMTYTDGIYTRGIFAIFSELSKSELRTFNYIFNHTHYGNVCYASQADMCKALNAYPSHMSTGVKHLISLGVFKKYRRGFMLNPDYFVAGPMEDKPKLTSMYDNLDKKEEVAHAENN
jgi:hypothetical protein